MTTETGTTLISMKNERTPLLLPNENKQDEINLLNSNSSSPIHTGTASISQTILTMIKTCLGTGCLALPYAASHGGIVLYVLGTAFISGWNVFGMNRLCHCLDLLLVLSSIEEEKEKETEELEMEMEEEEVEVGNENGRNNGMIRNNNIDPSTLKSKSKSNPPPLGGAPSLATVSYHAFGKYGSSFLDLCTAILLTGVVVAYADAARGFLEGVGFFRTTTSNDNSNTSYSSSILYPIVSATMATYLSVVPNVGKLSKISGVGLMILALSFGVVVYYGVLDRIGDWKLIDATTVLKTSDGDGNDDDNANFFFNSTIDAIIINTTNQTSYYHTPPSLNYLPPKGLIDISQWFGIVAFSYGSVPLTFNFRSSMKHPHLLNKTAIVAHTLVGSCYIIVGLGLYILYNGINGGDGGIEGDMLVYLPTNDGSILPLLVRLGMVGVLLVSAPLCVVPVGELIEGRVNAYKSSKTVTPSIPIQTTTMTRIIVRGCICTLATIIASLVPQFVGVIGLVGCLCVGLVAFCAPPALHLRLSILAMRRCKERQRRQQLKHERTRRQWVWKEQDNGPKIPVSWKMITIDVFMLMLGIFATVVGTAYTFHGLSS